MLQEFIGLLIIVIAVWTERVEARKWMRVLVLDSAYHGRQLIERSERGGPVGDREAGVVAGDQRAGDDEKKRGPGDNYDKPMIGRIVFNETRSRRQNKLL